MRACPDDDARSAVRRRGACAVLLAVCILFTPAAPPAAAASTDATSTDATSASVTSADASAQQTGAASRAEKEPVVTLSDDEAGAGGEVTVRGKGWRGNTLLTLLICGQNAIGGTNSCANSAGRAVTTEGDGSFSQKLPVAEPPKACPCVVRAATVTGAYAAADAKFTVAGHPVKPLPKNTGNEGRLSVLAARLEGSSGLLTWFGAPPQRQLTLTVGNLGAAPAENPVFDVGTAHGVYAPEWERQQWRGTVDPGQKRQVSLPVELAAGAHGDYTVSAKYGEKLLTEQPWDVGRPWGVTLFWVLLCVVVAASLFRVGMAVVDRVRPRRSGRPARPARRPGWAVRRRGGAGATDAADPAAAAGADGAAGAAGSGAGAGALPWFRPGTLTAPTATAPTATPSTTPSTTPDTTATSAGAGNGGSAGATISAPSDDRPPSKGSA